ncbi:hypothetical protein GE09DRAFT_1262879 [Coniochaeta sp. 2T2.1]|nr:hypothetical protein GE09DRAFT_1262879 [Coniochaeta sp. 2T2.1]
MMMLNYLSLLRGKEYASGITVFTSEKGLHGTKVYFSSSSSCFGDCSLGFPLHFALMAGEILTSAWIVAPYRTEYRPIVDSPCLANWHCLSTKSPTGITGLIFDAVTYRLDRVFRDIGVTEDRSMRGVPTSRARHYPEFERLPYRTDQLGYEEYILPDLDDEQDVDFDIPEGDYHTSWSLDLVAKLRSRRVRMANSDQQRVIGLQVVHQNGIVETLGQWDPQDADSIVEFYDVEEQGPLQYLDITANESPPYIKAITINHGRPGSKATVSKVYSSQEGRGYGERTWEIDYGWRLAWVFGKHKPGDNTTEEDVVEVLLEDDMPEDDISEDDIPEDDIPEDDLSVEDTPKEDIPAKDIGHWDDIWYYEPDYDVEGRPKIKPRQLEAII